MRFRSTAALLATLAICACSQGQPTFTGDAGNDGDATDIVDVSRGDGAGAASQHTFTCTGCPSTFPPPTAAACPGAPASLPTLLYPPDGTLMPPNLGSLEVQFDPGQGNTLFDVSFASVTAEVDIITHCTTIHPVQGGTSSACALDLTSDEWNAIALANRGRDPVAITVRGTTDAAQCTSTAADVGHISFSFENLYGTVYYWHGDPTGHSGSIYYYELGGTQMAPQIEASQGDPHACYGCHSVSQDGRILAYGLDDNDADDEYGDMGTQVVDLVVGTVLVSGYVCFDPGPFVPAGFSTISADHSKVIFSTYPDYNVCVDPPGLVTLGTYANSMITNDAIGPVMDSNGGQVFMTQPDISIDGQHIAFTRLLNYLQNGVMPSDTVGDDHFQGSDLWAMDIDSTLAVSNAHMVASGNMDGQHPNGSNYYPSISPDGNLIAFNHIDDGISFYNPNAQVWLTTRDGTAHWSLDTLNSAQGLTNSWPRWSPFVQEYKTGHIVWMTFSSNRDYGERVLNRGLPNCYPPASIATNLPVTPTEVPLTTCNFPTNPDAGTDCVPQDLSQCAQPQIWMAAVTVDDNGVPVTTDRSYPAFWFPYQDLTSHNHTAVWTQRNAFATCELEGDPCPAGTLGCCGGLTCDPTSHTCVNPCIPLGGACPGPENTTCCPGSDMHGNPIQCDPTIGVCSYTPG